MPDIKIEKETPFKKLNKEERTELAGIVSSWYKKFNEKRQSQISTAQELIKYIQLSQEDRNKEKEDEWKSNIKENKIYTTWDSLKSVMWKEIWSNESQMFEVVGVDKESEELADKQKEAVTHALKQMKAGNQYDLSVDYWGFYGDFVFKTDWKQKQKSFKRYDKTKGLIDRNLITYNNANIEAINPIFFEFDVTQYKPYDKESFDRCIKIYKRFMSLEEIKVNPLYNLSKEDLQELEDDEKTTDIAEQEKNESLIDKTQYGDLYEVLYLHGDITYKGIHYENIVIEVLAGKYLIYFDKNPIYINPFVYGYTERDDNTCRGISPLKSILELSKAKENLINYAGDIAALNSNPPQWADEDFIKEKYKNGKIKYAPGKVLEWTKSFDGKVPEQVKFDANGIGDIISVLANDISDASAINANVMGNIEQGKRTATEMQLANNGSSARVAMKLDKIYQISLQVIENVAELLAIFKTEPETILIKDKGQREEVEITTAVRQANYQYTYEDRNALIDRRTKSMDAFNMMNAAANNSALFPKIDWEEVLRTGLESNGFDNTDKFFKDDSPIEQLAEGIKKMPEQLQQLIIQEIMPVIKNTINYAQQMQQVQNQQGNVNADREIQREFSPVV